MTDRKRPAMPRYTRRVFIAMAGYLVALAVAVPLVRHGSLTGPLAWLLAVLPGLFVAGAFWAYGRLLVEEKDEYLRLLLVRQSLIATGFTLTIATAWGFLADFNQVPSMDAFYLVALWFIGLGVGQYGNRWLDRPAADDA